MDRLLHKKTRAVVRKHRVRQSVSGTTERPRLSVRITNRHVVAQLIDDLTQKTLVYATTVGQKETGKTMTEKAVWVGQSLAKKAATKKIKKAVLDRGSKLYHGRVKALADAAREAGLEF